MKIEFSDKSSVEVKRSNTPGKVFITIQARDHENNLKNITNSVELTDEQFKSLVSDV